MEFIWKHELSNLAREWLAQCHGEIKEPEYPITETFIPHGDDLDFYILTNYGSIFGHLNFPTLKVKMPDFLILLTRYNFDKIGAMITIDAYINHVVVYYVLYCIDYELSYEFEFLRKFLDDLCAIAMDDDTKNIISFLIRAMFSGQRIPVFISHLSEQHITQYFEEKYELYKLANYTIMDRPVRILNYETEGRLLEDIKKKDALILSLRKTIREQDEEKHHVNSLLRKTNKEMDTLEEFLMAITEELKEKQLIIRNLSKKWEIFEDICTLVFVGTLGAIGVYFVWHI